MNNTKRLYKIETCGILFLLLLMAACENNIERSGIVVDKQTNKPLSNVSIEVYMAKQKRDSLQEKTFTDSSGHFHVKEKRDEGLLFVLEKEGYIGLVSTISKKDDTIKLEKGPKQEK